MDKNYNKVYLTGSFNAALVTIDTITFQKPAASIDPMYLAGFDSSGHVFFAKALASGGDDQNSVSVSPSTGCIYVGGDFQPDSFIVGNDTLMGRYENIFLAKLCYSGVTANFTSSATNICAEGNNCINFSDHSIGNPTSWQWHFTGAIPDTSSQQNPTHICYSSAGTYAVTLIVTNSSGSDTLTVSPMITVDSPTPPIISIVGDTLFSSHGNSYQWYLNGNPITGATDSFYVWHQVGTYSVQMTDSADCSSLSGGIMVTVQEISGGGRIEVYPNPANNTFTIYDLRFISGATIEIYNVFGEKVYIQNFKTQNTKSEIRIDVSGLSNGVYFLKMDTGERIVNKKFVVLHH